ncbi:ras-related protein Rab-27B isoform X1 [Hydra vulgaris]|uniref:ras-related protein Rab-27B isoform X1 n=1 Tax=Hydra vulgaris TaxID=6087 RepID=UPI001F5E7581|nr:ras-related protein Rab-27B-like [Hydra vulgaris]
MSVGRNGLIDDRPDAVLKLLTLGDSGVGKTSFVLQFIEGTFTEKFVPTIGMDLREKLMTYQDHFKEERKVYLEIWDTAGQERFRSLTTAFFRDAMGFLLIFDISRKDTFVNVRSWLSQLQLHSNCDDPAMVLIGNKNDLDIREVDENSAIQLARNLGIKYFETSAKTGQNVYEAVETLMNIIMSRFKQYPERMDNMKFRSKKLENKKQENSTCYC